MNLERFNLGAFNISEGSSEDIDFTMYCHERFETVVTFSLNTEMTIQATEHLNTNTRLTITLPIKFDLNAEIALIPTADSFVIIKADGAEGINAAITAITDISAEIDVQEEIDTNIYASTNIDFTAEGSAQLVATQIYAAKDISILPVLLSENIFTGFKSTILNNSIARINTTLRPGETLEIDGDTFTAYIGAKNVLEFYNGDWIELSRAIESLNISSATGGTLRGKVIFKERFL